MITAAEEIKEMDDLISRQLVIKAFRSEPADAHYPSWYENIVSNLPSADPEIIRCKDCFYGYLYSGVYAGTTCSWVECKNPDGLNRDVSIDGYCSAAIRRKDNG